MVAYDIRKIHVLQVAGTRWPRQSAFASRARRRLGDDMKFVMVAITAIVLAVAADAQMGGMGMPMPSPMPSPMPAPMPSPMPGPSATRTVGPGTTHSGSGSMSKGAAIGVAAGAAGAGLLYWGLHNRATLVGCVGGDGDTLVNEADGRTYTLTSKNLALKPGERVELKGRTHDHGTVLDVHKIAQDFGPCSTTAQR